MNKFKDEFLLEKGIIFLNHGSFGACPKPVFDTYQEWQRELEKQPVRFLGRQAVDLLAESRRALAAYLNIPADNIVYTPNPTTAINMVVRSLDLKPGDEILSSEHEYGAMVRTWRFICKQTGANYIQRSIPLPLASRSDFIEQFLAGITSATRIIFLSHVTSQTALTFPVAEICARARELGILSIIDGAHVPGHIPLDIAALNPDIYTGACHKWLCAPKGSAFLYAHPDIQPGLDPLIVSWGYEADEPGPSRFIDYHEWQGTRDLAAFLTVPRAIQYQQDNHWSLVRQECHALALQAHTRINALTGQQPLSPTSGEWFRQMVAFRLPDSIDIHHLKEYLYTANNIEIPTYTWQGQPFFRVSFQAYNQASDLEALISALETYLNEENPHHEAN